MKQSLSKKNRPQEFSMSIPLYDIAIIGGGINGCGIGRDAAEKGAVISTRCPLLSAVRTDRSWRLNLLDKTGNREFQVEAKVLVNASGTWLEELQGHICHSESKEHIRMVKGSHIIVNRLLDHERAYIFQNADHRIIFAIPYENKFTLIGTTDEDFHGKPDEVHISPEH